jgi:nanoRNase/pAp phosphatase (c-di-AMP/oligoRNAs hydrolase)
MNLRSLLSESSKPLILGHQNADPDAVCAMIAFSKMYKMVNPEGTPILIADDLSRLSHQVIDTFAPGESILETEGIVGDLVVLLDTNSVFQLGPKFQKIPQDPSKTIVIDNLLLTGLIFDTRRFYFADVLTLQAAIKLIKYGADYEQCIKALLMRPDRSERIARLKAAGRVNLYTIGDWVIVTSKINAFEASVCRALIDMGADVAIVGGIPSKDVARISSRSTREFSTATAINLGKDVMEPLGDIIGGKGGGHANAAGANGTKCLEEAIIKSVELIRKIIEKEQLSSSKS